MKTRLACETLSRRVADAIDWLKEDLQHPDFASSQQLQSSLELLMSSLIIAILEASLDAFQKLLYLERIILNGDLSLSLPSHTY